MKRAVLLSVGGAVALLAACSSDAPAPAQGEEITGPAPEAGVDAAVPTLPAKGELALTTAEKIASFGRRRTSLHARVSGGAGPYRLAWTQTSGPAVVLEKDATLAASFVAPDVTAATDVGFSLLVVDALGTIAGATTTVTVAPNGLVAEVPATIRARDGQTVTLNAGIGGNLDGASFAWRQTSGPAVTITTPLTANAAVTFAAVAAPTTYGFVLDVTSREGTFARPVSVEVQPAGADRDDAGVLAAFAGAANLHANPGAAIALNGSARNAASPTYAWAQIGGSPAVSLSNAGSANPTFTAPDVTLDTQLTFRVTVTDGAKMATSDVNVNIEAATAFASGAAAAPTVAAGATTYPNGGATGGTGPYRWLWTQKSGPTLTIDGATAPGPRVVVPYVDTDATAVLTLTATDAAGKTESHDVSIAIVAPTQSANGPENGGAGFRPLTDAERTGYACTGLDCFTQGREVVCDERAPFPITVLTTSGQGKISITKRCTSGTGCLVNWWQDTRALDVCRNVLPPTSLGADSIANSGGAATCSYCCSGEGCNKDIIPVATTIAACEGGSCYPAK